MRTSSAVARVILCFFVTLGSLNLEAMGVGEYRATISRVSLSPDGGQLLFDANDQIYSLDVVTRKLSLVGKQFLYSPRYSPTGDYVIAGFLDESEHANRSSSWGIRRNPWAYTGIVVLDLQGREIRRLVPGQRSASPLLSADGEQFYYIRAPLPRSSPQKGESAFLAGTTDEVFTFSLKEDTERQLTRFEYSSLFSVVGPPGSDMLFLRAYDRVRRLDLVVAVDRTNGDVRAQVPLPVGYKYGSVAIGEETSTHELVIMERGEDIRGKDQHVVYAVNGSGQRRHLGDIAFNASAIGFRNLYQIEANDRTRQFVFLLESIGTSSSDPPLRQMYLANYEGSQLFQVHFDFQKLSATYDPVGSPAFQ